MGWTSKIPGRWLVVLGLFCTSCSRPAEMPFPEPRQYADSKDGELVSQLGELSVENRSYVTEFCTLTVRENRNRQNGNLLHLPVLRTRSDSPEKNEPVFLLAGGPGMPNINTHPPGWMLRHHDIVRVGYRGVDGSTSLDCPEVTQAFSAIDDPLSEQSLRDVGDAYIRGFNRLRAAGIDLNSYTMLDVIDDVEAARKALGYDKIHLYSGSYGTRVAYLYGLRYPEGVARSIMVGVNPPGHFIWEPEVNDEILKQYCERWNNNPTASARCADLEATIRRVLDKLPRTWIVFDIDPNKLRCMMFFMLYHQGSAVQMLDAFVAADQGDYSGLALMCFMFDYMVAGLVNWGDNVSKAMSADFDPSRDYIGEMMPKDSIIGSPFSRTVGFMQDRDWPIKSIPDEFRQLRTSGVQTLMINGNLDISTPAQFARDELLPHLPNGHLVVVSDMGHVGDVEHLQADAFQHLASTFLLTGNVDDSQFEQQPIDFNPSATLPKQAKKYLTMAVGGAAGVSLLLVSVSWLGWRRLRHRRIAKSTGHVAATQATL